MVYSVYNLSIFSTKIRSFTYQYEVLEPPHLYDITSLIFQENYLDSKDLILLTFTIVLPNVELSFKLLYLFQNILSLLSQLDIKLIVRFHKLLLMKINTYLNNPLEHLFAIDISLQALYVEKVAIFFVEIKRCFNIRYLLMHRIDRRYIKDRLYIQDWRQSTITQRQIDLGKRK